MGHGGEGKSFRTRILRPTRSRTFHVSNARETNKLIVLIYKCVLLLSNIVNFVVYAKAALRRFDLRVPL